MSKETEYQYYVVIAWANDAPGILGPFDSGAAQNKAAKRSQALDGYKHGIYWLDIAESGTPEMGAYRTEYLNRETNE